MPWLKAVEEWERRKEKNDLTPNEYKDLLTLVLDDEDLADRMAAKYTKSYSDKYDRGSKQPSLFSGE